jgi:hypothetical protein
MYKLNLIAIVSIVAAVSFVVGMTAPAAFAQGDNMTMDMDIGNMTGGNATSTTTMMNDTSTPNDNLTR